MYANQRTLVSEARTKHRVDLNVRFYNMNINLGSSFDDDDDDELKFNGASTLLGHWHKDHHLNILCKAHIP